jgi:outer membrane lipoprotein-sorting protein
MKTKNYVTLCALSLFFLVGLKSVLCQEKLTADQIMQKVDTRIIPQDMTAMMKMDLISKKGNVRSRAMKTYRMSDDKQIMWFLEPADVKGSSFLRLSHDDRDDDMWLYLPAFGKVRRIASHAKKGNFMGSNFTYEDLGDRKLKDYTYKLLKEETIGNKACWVVESIPKPHLTTDYAKIISWVWKDDYLAVKEEFYDKKGNLKKVMNVDLQRVDKYRVPSKITMEDLKSSHKTELIFDQIKVDTGLKDEIFSTNYMTRIY